MQLSRTSFGRLPQRAITLVAGLSLGIGAVLVAAAPASAHYSRINGAPICKPSGEAEITWTVTNDYRSPLRLEGVSASPAGSHLNLPDRVEAARRNGEASASGTQLVPAGTQNVTLHVDQIVWQDGWVQRDVSASVHLVHACGTGTQPPPDQPPAGHHPKPSPSPSPLPPVKCVPLKRAHFSHVFDGPAGTATVKLVGKKLCDDAKQPFSLISYKQPATPGGPQVKFDSSTGTVSNATPSTSLTVKLPPCGAAVHLIWGDKILGQLTSTANYGDLVLGSKGKPGSQSAGPLGNYEAPATACTDKPAVAFADSCTGVEITLSNTGTIPAEFFGESKVGNGDYKPFDKPVTVAPGKTATMAIKAAAGLSVRVTSGSTVNAEHKFAAPANCTKPTAPPAPPASGSPSLPVTGASVTILIVAALVLFGGGAALIVVTRRRRTTGSTLGG